MDNTKVLNSIKKISSLLYKLYDIEAKDLAIEVKKYLANISSISKEKKKELFELMDREKEGIEQYISSGIKI